MAEKMFAHQIEQRGLADVGPGDAARTPAAGMPATAPTAGRCACCTNTATRPSTAPPRSIDDHLSADMVVAWAATTSASCDDLGVDRDRMRMLRSFDPRSGAHALDVEDPYYGDRADFEETFGVIEAALPGLHEWVDERLAERAG